MLVRSLKKLELTPGDTVLITFFLLAGCAGILFIWRQPHPAESCIVQSTDGVAVVSLPRDTILVLAGPVGKTLVEIKGRRARVKSSDCRNKLCMRMGFIDRAGQTVVCVPNRVVLWLKGKGDFDG
ncbi:MAG: NusG domain II-containing protein, partial [candidate division WOR-3 bacterium]